MELGWRLYGGGEKLQSGAGVESALAARSAGDFLWIRVSDPDREQFGLLAKAFDLPELAVEDSTAAHQRPKLERYDDTLFLVLKPARYDDASETVQLGELHVFIGPDFAITVRHGMVGPLNSVRRRLDAHGELTILGPAAVMHAVADQVVDAYLPIVRGLEADISEIEVSVFDPEAQPPTERIYALMRQVLEFARATESLLLPLDDLARGRVALIHEDLREHFRDVADHARSVVERVTGFHQLLSGVLQANVALIGLQENRDQRKISAWAAIALVPTILGGVWGMNFDGIPLQHWAFGFPVVLGIMALVSGSLYWRLRRHGWL